MEGSPPARPSLTLLGSEPLRAAVELAKHALTPNGRRRKDVEDVEIEGSHLGMGWNQTVMKVVADRLAQAPRRWRPLQQVA